MKTVLVTGSSGFMGRNLTVALSRRDDVHLRTFDVADDPQSLESRVLEADVVFHLAGVNRPERVEEFSQGNTQLTLAIIDILRRHRRTPRIVLSSSTQAALDNPYGRSKLAAEEALRAFGKEAAADVRVYRFPGVFGKWSRPNYNSVVATFCHNIARGLPISISDPEKCIELVYIDDVVREFLRLVDAPSARVDGLCQVTPTFTITLGELAARINGYHAGRETLILPDFADELERRLHATYVSFLPPDAFAYSLAERSDQRGRLVELLKSKHIGQLFASTTKPGFTRGNHYHDTKVEKFCVVRGRAVIRFRHVLGDEVIEYPVSDESIVMVDIPPGYTHSIENVGETDMLVLFWASEQFDPAAPDTTFLEVLRDPA